jgi:hypothetical protein
MENSGNLPPLAEVMMQGIDQEEVTERTKEQTEELKDAIENNPTKFPEAMDNLVDECAMMIIEYMGMEVDEEEEYVKNISDEEREVAISVFLNLVSWGTIFAFMKGDSDNEEVNEVIYEIFTQAKKNSPDSLNQVMKGPIDIENEAMAMYNGLKRAFPRLARENPDRQMRIADSISAHKSIFEGLYIPFLNLLIDITEVKTGDEFGGGPPGNKIEWLEARYDFDLAPVVDDRYRKLKNAESHESHDSSSFTGSSEGIEIKGPDGDIEIVLTEDEFMEVVDLQAKSILQSLKHLNVLYTEEFMSN